MRSPHTAVVAYEMEGRPTGLGRYLEGLLGGLASLDAGRFSLFFKGDPFDHPLWADGNGVFEAHFDHRPEAHPILWEQLRLPRLLRRGTFDLLFSPANALPPGLKMPSLVTIHDLSFEHLGEEFGWKERWRRRFLARRAARRATRILTDSGAGARDLQATYGLGPQRLGIVPLGLDPKFFDDGNPREDLSRLRALDVKPPYLLFSGTLLPRRHPELLLIAFETLAAEHPDLDLVLNGSNALPDPAAFERRIEASPVAQRIHRLGYVPEDTLVPLYRQAELTFYLSSLEGYGLPPLESLAAGTLAVVSDGLALDDLWPDYAYRCPRLTTEDVIATTRAALEDDHRGAVSEEGVERMKSLTWERAAQVFLEEMRRVLP